jgi:hypothetical protein
VTVLEGGYHKAVGLSIKVPKNYFPKPLLKILDEANPKL